MKKVPKKIKFSKDIRRIEIPTLEDHPYKAISKVEEMKLPKHSLIGFEVRHYKGKDGFWATPIVFIEK